MQIRKLFYNIFLLALPLLLMVMVYIVLDPFRVVYSMKEYYPEDGSPKNIDYITGEVYLKNSKTRSYDSFIFGSSRSEAFKTKSWAKHISGMPFHFHASGEGIWGIYRKIKFLDEQGVSIRNALILLDESCLSVTNNPEGIIFMKHPTIAGTSWEAFHMNFFKGFIRDFYFFKWIRYKCFNGPVYKDLIDERKIIHDNVTNDIYYAWYDNEIQKDSLGFFSRLEKVVDCRRKDTVFDRECITGINKPFIDYITSVMAKHHTLFKVVISPNSSRAFFHPKDLAYLEDKFGRENVHDFSGINYFSSKVSFYYDKPHFRPVVADSILEIIYNDKNNTWN